MDDRELKMLMKSLFKKAEDNTPCSAEDEATFTALFSSGVSLLPFISSPTTAAAAPLDVPHSSPCLMPLPYSDFTYDSLTAANNLYAAASTAAPAALLRLPKNEPVSNFQDYFSQSDQTNINPFHYPQFYNNPPDRNLDFVMLPPPSSAHSFTNTPSAYHDGAADSHDYSSIFHHLPDLVSLDPFTSSMSPHSSSSSSSSKRPRFLTSGHRYSAASTAQFFPHPPHFQTFFTSPVSPASSPYAPPTPPPLFKPKKRATPSPPGSVLQRQRRQTFSDKTRCLQRLLPWDKKMDTATVFEEAAKYVKFLQAQLTALQAMPVITPTSFPPPPATACGDFGGLERLSRNQLLQVLLNSSVSQTVMYSQGCCVFSAEQLAGLSRRVTRSSRAGPNLFHHGCFTGYSAF